MGVGRHTACVHQEYQHKEGGERTSQFKKSSRAEKSKYVLIKPLVEGILKKNHTEQRGSDVIVQENFNSRHASVERIDQKNRFF